MIGFNRFDALKKGILDGKVEFVMMIADFHLINQSITQLLKQPNHATIQRRKRAS